MKRTYLLTAILATTLLCFAQQAVVNDQHHFPKTVPAGNYSGITYLGGDRYAVVNDKSPMAGFYLMTIRTDSVTGDILDVRCDSFLTSRQPNRDEEGICYVPHANSVFVSGEADGQIIEYTLDGHPTGRRLALPDIFSTAHGNSGFEALTYNATTHRFWTTTEQTLRSDGDKPNIKKKIPNRLRLQSFTDDLQPAEQYWYVSDSSAVTSTEGTSDLGISALAALDDGRLVVLEREIRKTKNNIGSFVHVKLFAVSPTPPTSPDRLDLQDKERSCELGSLLPSSGRTPDTLHKELIAEFRTRINLTARSFANYEGMCLGPRLADGRQLLILCADSQNQYRGILKDWFRSVVLAE